MVGHSRTEILRAKRGFDSVPAKTAKEDRWLKQQFVEWLSEQAPDKRGDTFAMLLEAIAATSPSSQEIREQVFDVTTQIK